MKGIPLVVVTLLIGSLPGCAVSTNDPVAFDTGALTVDWTINGSSDPNQCNQSVATDFDIVVTSPDGASTVGGFEQSCVDGVMTIKLAPGPMQRMRRSLTASALSGRRVCKSIRSQSTVVRTCPSRWTFQPVHFDSLRRYRFVSSSHSKESNMWVCPVTA